MQREPKFPNRYSLNNEFRLSSAEEAFIDRYVNIKWSVQLLYRESHHTGSPNKNFDSVHSLVRWAGIPFSVQVTPMECIAYLPVPETEFWTTFNKVLKQVAGCQIRAEEVVGWDDAAVKSLFSSEHRETSAMRFLQKTEQIRRHVSMYRNRLLCDDELNLILNYISRRGLDKLPEIARVKLDWHSRNMKI